MPPAPDPPPGDDPPAAASPDPAPPPAPAAGAPYDPTRGRRLGDPVDERPLPRGCHPLVFGVVMATIQFALTIYFWRTC